MFISEPKSALSRLGERPYLPYLLLALAVLVAYSNVYHNAFLFDDDLLISLNKFLRHWDNLGDIFISSTTGGAHIAGGFYRPMQILLYFITYQVADGQTRFGFHLLNVALHAANTCLGYALAQRLGFKPIGAFLAMLLWAVHPLHTEAVTYMSGTADPLFVFFTLVSLVLLAPDFSALKIIYIIPVYLLALGSKETAVVLPMLVVACLYLTHPDRWSFKTYLRTWPLWLMTALYLSWRMTTLDFDGPATYSRLYQLHDFDNLRLYAENPSWRVMTFLATLPNYLELLFWPTGLHMERSFMIYNTPIEWPVAIGAIMVLGAAAQIIWGFWQKKPQGGWLALSWGFLWFGAAHLPDSGLGVAVNSLFLEHWMYLPTLGLSLGMAQAITLQLEQNPALRDRQLVIGVALIAAMALGARTWDQNTLWHDPVVFYGNIFKYGEVSARARNNLALAYMAQRQTDQAIEQFHQALAITDTYAETRYNLALAILSQSTDAAHIDLAIDNLKQALVIDPHFYRASDALSQIYAHYKGDAEQAAQYGQMATESGIHWH